MKPRFYDFQLIKNVPIKHFSVCKIGENTTHGDF